MLAQHATSMKTPVLLSIKVFMGDERTPQLTAETFYPFFYYFILFCRGRKHKWFITREDKDLDTDKIAPVKDSNARLFGNNARN